MNINKTRIVIYEPPLAIYPNLVNSINNMWFDIVAIINDGSGSQNQYTEEYPSIAIEDILDFSFWDLLVVNDSRPFHDNILKILSLLNIPEERYVFLSDNNVDYDFYQILFSRNSALWKYADYARRKSYQNYFAVSTEEGDYLTNSMDNCISANMFFSRETFSKKEIEGFIELAKQYYGISQEDGGYFMDIGANIGTTSIYVKRNLLPNVKIIAFEPIKETFKLLRINMLLNNIEDSIVINKAISDDCESHSMAVNAVNPGGSSIIDNPEEQIKSGSQIETVSSVTVEKFLEEQAISPSEIRLVWIDTEGFEPEVLSAATSLLQEKRTAFYMEYSPEFIEVERLNKLADICSMHFSEFICMDDYISGDESPHPIQELYDLYKKHPKQTDIFLIK